MRRKIAITLAAILLSPLLLSCKGAPVGPAPPDAGRAGYEILRAKIPGYFFDRRKAQALTDSVTPESFDIRVNELMLRDLSRQGYDLREALRSFGRPVLIIQGRQDPLGESPALQIQNTFPQSTLQFIEQCGHIPMIEQPDAFFATVEQFLRNHPEL